MKPQTLDVVLEKDQDGTWHYVHVAKGVRDAYKSLERRGTIAVTVTIGSSTWPASMLPWADGSAQISINKKVREKENLQVGRTLKLIIEPRKRD
jgi:uncharacterized protein DUF1905